jgi:hypothetical protein
VVVVATVVVLAVEAVLVVVLVVVLVEDVSPPAVVVTVPGLTAIMKDLLAPFPALSRAEHVTVVVPTAKLEPETWSQVTGSVPSTTSVAEVVNGTGAVDEPPAACTVMSAGTESAGGVVSLTVTANASLVLFPAASVAAHFTPVVPSGNVVPDWRPHPTRSVPSTMSVAETWKLTVAPDGPVASTVKFAGTVRVGGVVSDTVTLKDRIAVILNVAVQVTAPLPSGNVDPERGSQATAIRFSWYVAVGKSYVTTAPAALVASATMSSGNDVQTASTAPLEPTNPRAARNEARIPSVTTTPAFGRLGLLPAADPFTAVSRRIAKACTPDGRTRKAPLHVPPCQVPHRRL